MKTRNRNGEMVFICDVCESGTTDQRSMRVCEGTFLEDGTQATPPCEPDPEYKLLCPSCHCEDCEVEQDAPSVDVRVDSFSAEAFWGDMSVEEVIDKLMERSEEDSQVMQQDAFVQGKMEILNTFTTKGYTSWVAHEGVGAQTTLYKDGKIVGWCTDEGQGGQVDFRANTVEDRTMVFDFVKSLPKYEFNDYWKEQYGEEWEGKPELHSWNVFTFANIMLEQEERKERGINEQLR